MRHPVMRQEVISLLALAFVIGGCSRGQDRTSGGPVVGSKPNFTVERFELGNAIDGEKKVVAPATRFKASDTIYASVVGSGHATRITLRTRWLTSSGRLTYDASQHIFPSGPIIAEFHSPAPNNWPAGSYKVELTMDTHPGATAEFTIAD